MLWKKRAQQEHSSIEKKSRYDIDAQGIKYRNIWNLQTPRCRCCWNVVREPCEVYKLKVEVISIVRNLRESN